MRLNVNGEPLAPAGSDNGRKQVRAAFRAWGRVPTTSFRYVEGAATTRRASPRTASTPSVSDPHGEISQPSGCSGVLAIGGMYFQPPLR